MLVFGVLSKPHERRAAALGFYPDLISSSSLPGSVLLLVLVTMHEFPWPGGRLPLSIV